MVLAFVRAIYQYGMQDEFIKYIFEDAEEGITYSVPFIELLLTNICIFTLVNICYLILNTFTINSSLLKVDNEELSPQLKLRMECRKEKHPKVYTIKVIVTKIVLYVLMFMFSLLTITHYEIQLQSPLRFRMGILAGIIVACVVMYFIGKKRYCPKYI